MYVNLCEKYLLHMKYSVVFYPEKRKNVDKNVPLLLSITFSGKRVFYYTGKRCDIMQWDADLNKISRNQIAPNGQSSRDFNADLSKIELAVNNLFKGYDLSGELPTKENLRKELDLRLGKKSMDQAGVNFFDYFDKFIDNKTITDDAKVVQHTVLNNLKRFKNTTTFASIDSQFLKDFYKYLLAKRSVSKNTACKQMSILRGLCRHATRCKLLKNDPFSDFEYDKESYGIPVYITLEERDKIYTAKLEDNELEITRDLFIFQCSVGCRVSDMLKLKKNTVINNCLEYIASKTKDHKPRVIRVPLTSKAISIIEKYNGESVKLLPFMDVNKYNKNLKLLFEKLKLTRLVTVPDKKTRESIQVPISEIVSSHMARRVFIGGLFKKGVRTEIIASMSGHVAHSKEFARYYAVDRDDQKVAINLIE